MIQVELSEFLHTGWWGGLTLGLPRQRVLNLLGAPTGWGIPDKDEQAWARLWHYGALELAFTDGLIAGMQIDFYETPHFPPSIKVLGYFPNVGTTLQQMAQHLDKLNLSYQPDESSTFKNQICWRFLSNAYMIFDEAAILRTIAFYHQG